MPKEKKKTRIPKAKAVPVRAHPMRVPVSKRNPTGITIRDAHLRHLNSFSADELMKIFNEYPRKKLSFPKSGVLLEYPDADVYDELIAVWCAYFNEKFPFIPPYHPLDPSVIKALLGSESSFNAHSKNQTAIGIAQITPETLKALQDQSGELKDYSFRSIRQKDLKDPSIAIPLAIRWYVQKKKLAEMRLRRAPTPEEVILEYKGLLKSSTQYKDKALKKYRELYSILTGGEKWYKF